MKNLNLILLGLVTGAAVGILFAPDKGSETRKKLTKKGGELADSLKDNVSKLIDDIVGKYEDLEEEYSGTEEKMSH